MPGITGEFREIVEAHQSRVFSIAYRVLGDRGTAEEVAQDVFLELYRALDEIASDEHLIAWLRRVAVHRATDALRRRPRVLHGAAEFQDWMGRAPEEEGSLPLASEIERLLLELGVLFACPLCPSLSTQIDPTPNAERRGLVRLSPIPSPIPRITYRVIRTISDRSTSSCWPQFTCCAVGGVSLLRIGMWRCAPPTLRAVFSRCSMVSLNDLPPPA